jgi:hypothetical protein
MACRLIAFTSNPTTIEESVVVASLMKHFDVMVDALNAKNASWLEYQFKDTQHRFYKNDNDSIYPCDTDDEDILLAIYFDKNVELPDDAWEAITDKLNNIMYGVKINPHMGKVFAKVNVRALKPETKDIDKNLLEPVLDEHYRFRTKYFEDRDVMLAEVTKPFTPCPYVVVIRNYKTRGYEPVFSGLFVSTTWNVSRDDVPFLKNLWSHLEMVGEFDMQKLLGEAVEKCLPGKGHVPEAEPELYRDTIENVLQTLQDKSNGIKRPRK